MALKLKRVREAIPLKQGLKHNIGIGKLRLVIVVREAIPLKQGLKLSICLKGDRKNCRSRGDSIKTRIETSCFIGIKKSCFQVREAIPLKQGLKQQRVAGNRSTVRNVREAIPLKQGLKHSINHTARIETFLTPPPRLQFCRVREAIPLKQGLKLSCSLIILLQTIVREAIPLKQGLKQFHGVPQ